MVTLVGLKYLNFVALDESCKLESIFVSEGGHVEFYDEFHGVMLNVQRSTMKHQYKQGYEFMLLGMKRWEL